MFLFSLRVRPWGCPILMLRLNFLHHHTAASSKARKACTRSADCVVVAVWQPKKCAWRFIFITVGFLLRTVREPSSLSICLGMDVRPIVLATRQWFYRGAHSRDRDSSDFWQKISGHCTQALGTQTALRARRVILCTLFLRLHVRRFASPNHSVYYSLKLSNLYLHCTKNRCARNCAVQSAHSC